MPQRVPADQPDRELLELYDAALPTVYGYLLSRCRQSALAEELTSETFVAAVDAVRHRPPPSLSTAWVIGVARHKLVDHWRRCAREARGLHRLDGDSDGPEQSWEVHLDAMRAQATLERLAPQHRAALTLRYLDDLPVSEVAELLDRSVHATEALLVRARSAFRRAHGDEEGVDA